MNRRSFLGLGLRSVVLATALSTGLGRTALNLAEKLDVAIKVAYDLTMDLRWVRADVIIGGVKWHQVQFVSAGNDDEAVDICMPNINHWIEAMT